MRYSFRFCVLVLLSKETDFQKSKRKGGIQIQNQRGMHSARDWRFSIFNQ